MATISKPTKSMSFQNEKTNDLLKAQKSIELGATTIIELIRGKEVYAIEFPTGGYYRITKSIYNKLNNN
jgi:hypothetical protein